MGGLHSAEAAGTHRRALAVGPSPSSGVLGVTSVRTTSGAGGGRGDARSRSWTLPGGDALSGPAQTQASGDDINVHRGGGGRRETTARKYQLRGRGRHRPEVHRILISACFLSSGDGHR